MHPAQLQPGYRLDRYELLCPLAYGGMASVWLARFGGRLGFERIIVIEMILPRHSQDPRFQEMFLDEARIVSRIEHPNVARILDVGEHQGSYYIVMEWVDGDLKDICPSGRCAPGKQDEIDGARLLGNVSTIGFVAGGVFAGVGIVGLVLSRRQASNTDEHAAPHARLHVTPVLAPSYAGLRGTF